MGPGAEAAGGWWGEVREGGAVGGMREGYLRAVGAAARAALEVVEPIVWDGQRVGWCRGFLIRRTFGRKF